MRRKGTLPLLIAHRCGAALGPENSVHALRLAFATGSDAVETDVRMTSDGVLVCHHDADLTRLTGRHEKISDLTFSDIKALHPTIMTVAECLAASQAMCVLFDVKDNHPTCLENLSDILRHEPNPSRLWVGLREPQSASSFSPHLYGYQVLAFAKGTQDGALWNAVGATWFRIWENEACAETLADLKTQGFKVAVMTGDRTLGMGPFATGRTVGETNQKGMKTLFALQPDAIMLDNPVDFLSLVSSPTSVIEP